jgi:tetratricopeptide (TPR) repeat protein
MTSDITKALLSTLPLDLAERAKALQQRYEAEASKSRPDLMTLRLIRAEQSFTAHDRGEYDDSYRFGQDAIARSRKMGLGHDPGTAWIMLNNARIDTMNANSASALRNLETALVIADTAGETEIQLACLVRIAIAEAHVELRQFSKANACLAIATAHATAYFEVLGPTHRKCLHAAAKLMLEQQQPQHAIPILHTLIRERQAELSLAVTTLARAYEGCDDFEAAATTYERARHLTEAALGTAHRNLATILTGTAFCFARTGRATAALPLYRRSIELSEFHFGPHGHNTLNAMAHCAETLLNTGASEEAAVLIDRTYRLCRHHLPRNEPLLLTADRIHAKCGLRQPVFTLPNWIRRISSGSSRPMRGQTP